MRALQFHSVILISLQKGGFNCQEKTVKIICQYNFYNKLNHELNKNN